MLLCSTTSFAQTDAGVDDADTGASVSDVDVVTEAISETDQAFEAAVAEDVRRFAASRVQNAATVAGEQPELNIDGELENKPIASVNFSCDLPVCQNPVGVDAFTEITGLKKGDVYQTSHLRFAEERLAKTGFFEALRVEKELKSDGVHITIQAKGATLIRRVLFEGVKAPPFKSDVRKIITYRQGQPFLNDKQKAAAQLESIRNLYEREGFFGTEIEMRVKRVEKRKHQVDLVFVVKKGEQRRVCGVGIRGLTELEYSQARDLLFEDFSALPPALRFFPIYFTESGFKAGREALIKEYREKGFFQMRIVQAVTKVDNATNCVDLLVDVSEGPFWQIEFKGSERFDDDQLRGVLPFFESGYVDRQEIKRAEFEIKRLYETRGYPFADVRGEETRRTQNERFIAFNISEGRQREVQAIRLHGNTVYPTDELLDGMKTKPFGLFETGGNLQTDKLLNDFSAIEARYQADGWVRATVNRFEVKRTSKGVEIDVYIDEGKQISIDRIDIDGNRVATDGALKRVLASQSNKPFVPLNLKADLSKLKQTYATFGYPMAVIRTECRLLSGEQVLCEAPRRPPNCIARTLDDLEGMCRYDPSMNAEVCQRVQTTKRCEFQGGVESDALRIRHDIDEGPRMKVGAILLKGNFDTDSSVIYREVTLKRDDLLDTNRVVESQGNLRTLNLFDSVSLETIGLDGAAEDDGEGVAALLIQVEEGRETKSIDFKFGFELRELLSDNFQFLVTGEAQYNDRNVFGQGIGLQPRIISAFDTLDLIRLGQDTAFQGDADTRRVDFLLGAEIILSHPRFLKSIFGIDKLYATFAPFYLIDLLGVINRQVLREEGGVRIEFRKELAELLKRFFLQVGFEVKSIASFAPDGPIIDGTRVFSPRRTIGTFTPELRLDRRDSPLNPTTGFLARIEPSIVSGDAFGQGGEKFVQDSFLKLTLGFSFYLALWEDFVLGQGVRAGQIFPIFNRENPVPADERYFLGGVRSVRGFPDGTLGPVGSNQLPSGGEFMINYNAELRYPLFREYGIFGATFFDLGLLSDCRDSLTQSRNCYENAFGPDALKNLRPAAGIGVRALILDQIPVVLDYGVVLDRQFGEQFGEIHFNVGYTFD